MLVLSNQGLENQDEWVAAGYALPQFNRQEVIAQTKKEPMWIHFGAGNIFRAFQANVVQKLLNDGILTQGLTVCEGYDYEIIEKMNHPHDDYSLLITLKADGSVEKTVVGSVAESLVLDTNNELSYTRLKEIFSSSSLQMATFTITEKGYSLVNGQGLLLPDISNDLDNGPHKTTSYLGKMVSLLYTRFLAGEKPIAMVSMDNCSHNGDKLFDAVHTFSKTWEDRNLCESGFDAYVNDNSKVSFPWTMIDKITPRPDPSVQEMLIDDNLEDAMPIITSKNTYVAPFVNAEECEYLVIEDCFPNGRPPLEKGGILFTNRETVDKVEKMKVCTCLNPLHTALAIFGCLLGHTKISEEMKDEQLLKLVEIIGYTEGLPVVINPEVINPKEFIDAVLTVRLPNPFMPDTPQRIVTDTSQKLAIRFGETIKAYLADDALSISDLKLIPLVYAGWIRYLMGINDAGETFELSSDPLAKTVSSYVATLRFGNFYDTEEDMVDLKNALSPLLRNTAIFGVDLVEIGMADCVCNYLIEMLIGPGAIRKTLEKYTI